MRAVRIHNNGGTEMLQFEDIPEPDCDNGKVKIRIHASGINHLDIWVRNGLPGINSQLPMILGSDGAGIIVETGSEVKDWKPGDEVVIQPGIFCGYCSQCRKLNENYCHRYGILGETENGVQAEYISIDPMNIHAKSEHLTFSEASSMQLVFMTAYQMLVKRANLQKNETVLIYGGTSGVGSAAIQICRDLDAKIIATVGSPDKRKHAEKMGADNVVIHSDDNWLDEVKRITGKSGVDLVFEHIGKSTWEQSLKILARGGRIVTCGATTGKDVNIDLGHLFMKQQSIIGSTMSNIETFRKVMEKIHNKVYLPFVDEIFPMKYIRQAHEYIENRQHMGKVVMEFDA